jgi:hypothetical protein
VAVAEGGPRGEVREYIGSRTRRRPWIAWCASSAARGSGFDAATRRARAAMASNVTCRRRGMNVLWWRRR